MYFVISFFVCVVYSYLPIITMHGIDGTEHNFDTFRANVQKYHPGTDTYSLSCYNKLASWSPMMGQIECIIGAIYERKQEYKFDKFHLVCHSQGSLACRIALQMMENHGVDKFISLSGPQLGEYGIPELDDYLPNLIRNMTLKEITNLLYSDSFLSRFSFAQYWHDIENRERYLTKNTFLPVMNNETYNPKSKFFKKNFLELNQVVLFGSPQDEVIQPYFSAFFAFYKDGKMKEMVEMKDQYVYLHDTFGLKTLDEQNKIVMHSVDNVKHNDWLYRDDLFKDYILQYLD